MNKTARLFLAAALLGGISTPLLAARPGQVQTGVASYYHDSLHGRRTASGQVYNKNRITAAHRHLPMGTEVRVTDKRTGRSVDVRINDRGPFVRGRVIDLSRAAASELGIIRRGITSVKVEVLSIPGRQGT
ncbi:MAG: septal ring lytic transglycosylase RlpA family protein [Chromatiaceae bacterium]|nr:MAG: septal ring lytic transglycosylase RlpA family protein [Chromatiaceae bacterium]